MSKKCFIGLSVALLLGAIILTVLDSLNLGYVSRLNASYITGIWGNVIVLFLFLFSYWKIDSHNIRIENNKRESAKAILRQSHINAARALTSGFYDSEITPVQKKLEKNSPFSNGDDGTYGLLTELVLSKVFQYNDVIVQYLIGGVITDKDYTAYVDMKDSVSDYLGLEILFPSKRESENPPLGRAYQSVQKSWKIIFGDEDFQEAIEKFSADLLERIVGCSNNQAGVE